DVVLFENPNGSLTSPVTTWSDVVHFQDSPTGGQSIAIMYADLENGVILPAGFTLSANAVGIVEIQIGAGNDNDFTNYTPSGSNITYTIHSDAAGNEIPDPETPEPGTLILFGGGMAVIGLFRLRRRRAA